MIDAHSHLQFEAFDEDRDAVLERARERGVGEVVIAGYDDARRALSRELGGRDGVLACAGIHPWALPAEPDEAWLDEQLERLERALAQGGWAAVGECGLDWARAIEEPAREFQRRAFERQLELALEHELALVVHAVRCHEPLRGLLEQRDELPPLHLHGWSGPAHLVGPFLELGATLSFGPPLTWSGHRKIKDSLERVVELDGPWTLETDAPDRPIEGAERGEPAHVVEVAQAAAALLERPVAQIEEATDEAACALFGVESAGGAGG